MPYIQNSAADRQAMLDEIGVGSIQELFAPIPKPIQFDGELAIDAGLTETELKAHMETLGAENRPAAVTGCFLGAAGS